MRGLASDFPPPPPPPARPSWFPGWKILLGWVCRYLLAAVFLVAAITKVTNPNEFTDRLVLHSPLPASVAWVAGTILPWLELTCGLCLLVGFAVREAAVILSVLLVVFLVYSLFQRTEADCGCLVFPSALKPVNSWPWLPLRNLVLLACSLWVVWKD